MYIVGLLIQTLGLGCLAAALIATLWEFAAASPPHWPVPSLVSLPRWVIAAAAIGWPLVAVGGALLLLS